MKTKLVTTIMMCLLSSVFVMAQDNDGLLKNFFRARPVPNDRSNLKPVWEFKPTVQIPAIKITQSARDSSILDASFIASTGGGITLQKTTVKGDKNYALFSWSPLIVLLTGDTSKDAPLDLSVCSTIGGFNNLVQIGVGYDFGKVESRSRFFLVLSLGINLTNN